MMRIPGRWSRAQIAARYSIVWAASAGANTALANLRWGTMCSGASVTNRNDKAGPQSPLDSRENRACREYGQERQRKLHFDFITARLRQELTVQIRGHERHAAGQPGEKREELQAPVPRPSGQVVP